MTNPLVTPAMLKRVRTLGARMLTDTFTHLARTIDDNAYGDSVEVFVDMGDYKGWIRQMNSPDLGDGVGLISGTGIHRLELEPTAFIHEGDMVADTKGNLYVVNNANTEDTIRVYTTVIGQKLV